MPPYYTLMVQPGTNNLEFVSLRSFVPFSDNDQLKTLSAFMTVSSDPGRLREAARLRDVEPVARRALARPTPR